jgi:hypothetical protein
VFENRMLRRILGLKRVEITPNLRIVHNEELHNLYSLSDMRMFKSRMRWIRHIVCMKAKRTAFRTLVGKHERNHYEDLDGRIY